MGDVIVIEQDTLYQDGCLKKRVYGYYTDILLIKHKDDGPAMYGYNQNGRCMFKQYYQHGLLHRIDGPASEYTTRIDANQWFIRGKSITREQHEVLHQYEYESPEWEFTWEMM